MVKKVNLWPGVYFVGSWGDGLSHAYYHYYFFVAASIVDAPDLQLDWDSSSVDSDDSNSTIVQNNTNERTSFHFKSPSELKSPPHSVCIVILLWINSILKHIIQDFNIIIGLSVFTEKKVENIV